jgi:hypothetical protein
MQCDAGLGYYTDDKSSGFFADLCGIKAWNQRWKMEIRIGCDRM